MYLSVGATEGQKHWVWGWSMVLSHLREWHSLITNKIHNVIGQFYSRYQKYNAEKYY